MMRSRRTAVALLALCTFAGLAPARADNPDPFSAIQDLVTVSNVQATGYGPTQIFVAWDNQGECAGFQIPCVTIANTFNIQSSLDEAGPYKTVSTYTNSCLHCVTSVTNNKLGLDFADARPVFIRVVPVISTPPVYDPNGAKIIDTVGILNGRPSDPDPAVLGPKPPTEVLCNGGGALDCVNVNHVTLTWTDNSDEKWFWIMRAKGATGANFGVLPHATVGENVSTFSETLDEFSVVFQYRIVAVRATPVLRLSGSVDSERSYSNCDSGDGKTPCTETVQTAPIPPPSSPSALSAVFTPPQTAKLTWVDKELNPDKSYIDEDGWFIEQTPDFLANGQVNWKSRNASQVTKSPGDPGTGVRMYVDNAFPLDTTRCYRVRGWRAGPAYSEYTNLACIGSTPKAPTNLVATATSNALVNLTWTDNSSSETGDSIERCDGVCTAASAGWTEIGTAPSNATSFSDTTTSGLHTYSYRVFAVNPSGKSPSSNIALVTTPPAPIATPLNLQATGLQHAIRLDWLDVSGETGYEIDYRTPGGQFSFLTSVGANVNTYVDNTSLRINQTRCYQVRALDGPAKKSDPSNEACATTLPSMPPAAPSNLSVVTGGVKNTSMELSWLDNASNETNFVVEFISFPNTSCSANPDVVDSTFYKWGTAPALSGSGSTGNFTVTGLIPHSAYFFRVKATNQDGESAYANAATPYRTDYPSTTACVQTAGPLRPVWTDPTANGDTQAFRCDVTLQASDLPGDPGRVGGIKLYVNAYVPGSSLGNTDTIYVGNVPGVSPELEDTPVITSGDGTADAQWQIKYHFRHGFYYRLLATTYTADANRWSSATGIVSDVTVYADCPLS